MPNIQYIGARYVPKFFENSVGTSDWRSNTQYEPLTIVTRNGNSYTSKKPVPANIGAPENNADYWVSTGIYSAQVQQLSDDITAETTARTNADNALDGRVTTAQNGVNANTAAIAKLKANYRFAIFIGDSYGLGYTINDGIQSANWISKTAEYLGLTSGVTYVSAAQNGAGFARTVSFLSLLQSVQLPAGVTANDVTDVIVCGGYNDHAPDSGLTISSGCAQFVQYAKSTYPNARIWGGFIAWSCNPTVRNTFSTSTINEYRTAFASRGVRVIPNAWKALHNYAYLSSDGFHPLATGHQVLSRAIAAWLAGGGFDPTENIKNVESSIQYATGVSNANVTQFPVRLRTQMLSENILFYFGGVFTISLTGSSNQEIELFTFRDSNVAAQSTGSNYKIPIWMRTTAGKTYDGVADVVLTMDSDDPHLTHFKVHPYVNPQAASGVWLNDTFDQISLAAQQMFVPYEYM